MTPRFAIFAAALSFSTLATAGYVYWNWLEHSAASTTIVTAAAAERKALYYRDPGGAPSWSATPKNDAQGRAFLPVYDDAEPTFDPPANPAVAQSGRKILFYRNPMGLPDTSPVPKKDPMGMDYIPVYEGDAQEQGGAIKLSVERIQRSGVRTEPVQSLVLIQPVRAVAAVALDERRLTVVSMRSEGYVEDLFVDTTGQTVREGEPLFRVYSPDIQQALPICSSCRAADNRPQHWDSRASTARCAGCVISAFLKTVSRNCVIAVSIRAQSIGRRLLPEP